MAISMQESIEAIVGVGNVMRDEPMAAHTTFRVGGPADYFVAPASVDEVKRIVALCDASNLPLHVLGCGSNVLVSDAGLQGVVMRIGPKLADVDVLGDGRICAGAGATNAKIARIALSAGLGGFEFAAGIPGSIGGAAIMNAGAYGGELRDVAIGATCLAPSGVVRFVSAQEADWSYRHSMMGDAGYIVLSVDLQLARKNESAIKERMNELAAKRNEKQPLDMPSAGSTFKRPEGHFAGKLIQDAGMQGHRVGGAQVSMKHAGFVVNAGGATASDVRQVIADVRNAVLEQFGVELEPEVKMWGF